jgi:hypothetical protein
MIEEINEKLPEVSEGKTKDRKKYEQELRDLIKEVNDLSLQKFGGGKRVEWFWGKQREFRDEIKERYPDFESFLSYHVFIGSSPSNAMEKIDFPEPYSVRSFLERLIKELNKKDEKGKGENKKVNSILIPK